MQQRTKCKIGWGLSLLIAVMLIGVSAPGKFTEWEGKAEMFAKMGVTNELIRKIGVVEILVAILYVIPQTSFVGAILLTGYLGGAIMTHLRIGDPYYFPIVMGVLAWVALGLRRPEVFVIAFGGSSARSAETPPAP
jgi:hypothetical protein